MFYCFGFYSRNYLLKVKGNFGFTEPGLLLISFLFFGYLLNLFNIDNNVRNYFPDRMLITSGVAFFSLIIISIFTSGNHSRFKFINIIIMIIILYLLHLNQETITSFMFNNPKISDYIIGTPIIFLGLLLTGLGKYLHDLINPDRRLA